jgi:hypothetical protein
MVRNMKAGKLYNGLTMLNLVCCGITLFTGHLIIAGSNATCALISHLMAKKFDNTGSVN